MNRTLDYVPRLVEANRAYRLTAPDPALLQSARYWTPGYPVLDQGREGACVGFGCTGEAMASPVRWKNASAHREWIGDRWLEPYDLSARDVYRRAKEIDEWEGVDYEGTSVRAGMLVGRERGWWSGFRWAFNLLELRAALEDGPVVVGIDVLTRMFDPEPDGDWIPEGRVEGGHCTLVTGYSPNYGRRGPRYRIRNSWGRGWGVNGNAYISPENLDRILFQAGGEAAVPVGRAL